MLSIHDFYREIPVYGTTPLTDLHLLYDPEHLYPYTSCEANDTVATVRKMRFVAVENDALRVTIAPELGGRVYSLFDKRIGQEILYCNPVVKPTRILPVWAFLSGGIEFSFPISHSPTSAATVGCRTGRIGDYAFAHVGEREARTGMEWVVEFGLKEQHPFVIQRTALRNPTQHDHPWVMWTNCAVRSTEQTEYVFPDGPAFRHTDECRSVQWPACGLNWEKNIQRMTGIFSNQKQANHFGAFHHDLGFGLLHLADPQQVPGKKLWSYGRGRDRRWGELTSDDGSSYAEIQSGRLEDQGQNISFQANGTLHLQEFWIPVHSRAALNRHELPQVDLPPLSDPWLGYQHSAYQCDWENYRTGQGPLPASPVPPGIDLLAALERDVTKGSDAAREPLAVYLAFHRDAARAIQVIEHQALPKYRRLAGLIRWRGLGVPNDAIPDLEAGPLGDPYARAELDTLYEQMNLTSRRVRLLEAPSSHRLILERRVNLLLVLGKPTQARELLLNTSWPLQHQRYVRSRLWASIQQALGQIPEPVPESLGEDDLATFGVDWSALTYKPPSNPDFSRP